MTSKEYITHQQRSRKWEACLYSIARELEAQLDQSQLIILMRGAGERMAQGFPELQMETLDDVEAVINDVWKESDWGWVKFSEEKDIVKIEHHFSPLKAALGEPSKDWGLALLEGFYTKVFQQLGAAPELAVRQVSVSDDDGITTFNLCVA